MYPPDQWSDRLHVGLAEMDEQHDALLALLLGLDALIDHAGTADPAVRAALDRIDAETRIHFKVEETLMRVSGYPQFESHRAGHQQLSARLVHLLRHMNENEQAARAEVHAFVREWIDDHVKAADREFADYFGHPAH